MDEKIEVKVNKELYNDLSSIMSEEYEKRMLITPSYCANKLLEKGYRKESDTARELAKTIKSVVWEEFENETIRIKDLHGVIDDILRSKYGVDFGE